MNRRLASLDILRGADLWLLLFFGPVAAALVEVCPGLTGLQHQIEHVPWHGFVLWDIIMPLFLFMSGITIPFSMGKYRDGLRPDRAFYLKLLRRFCLLFFLGWVVQGNLLAFDWKQFHPFANTLQAIAVGYVVAALLFIHFDWRAQAAFCAGFFALYALAFVLSGSMDLDPQGNIAMLVDKAVLGSHRDGVTWKADGSWRYDGEYQYTWILSSLNFAVTVMLGCFAGEILRNGRRPEARAGFLALSGAVLVLAGLALDPLFPIVKKIWSSSMTLFSGGLCFLLIALTYYLVDVHGWHRGLDWLKYYGMNSIAAYCIGEVVDFSSVSASLLHGFSGWAGYPVLIVFGNVTILFFILRLLYRRGIFLKV
ncbi:MAG: DUF5009 domain-containing protein [Bacteroidales bacterium]|nr:DUF5009 domain-containing protein [Bacteroidales bacterium]